MTKGWVSDMFEKNLGSIWPTEAGKPLQTKLENFKKKLFGTPNIGCVLNNSFRIDTPWLSRVIYHITTSNIGHQTSTG